MKKILIIGQTPPPYGGQAIIIDYMLHGNYKNVKLFHVRMEFSKEFDERGKISFKKIYELFKIISQVLCIKYKNKINILYYPLSNSPKISVLRDAFILLITRLFFKKIIFHFHAAGISEELEKFNFISRKIIYTILKKPDLGIMLSSFNPNDGKYLRAKKNCFIPYGIPETALLNGSSIKNFDKDLILLFVGLLNSTKGEGYLLEALQLLKMKNLNIYLKIAGKFESEEYKTYFYNRITEMNLAMNVEYLGVITGDVKHKAFVEADIFCFPSFFVSESFGIVLLEAMQYGLPLIATRWRGIQSIVEENINGFLVDIKSSQMLAEKIELFCRNRELIRLMGENSIKLYYQKYTIERYIRDLDIVFGEI
jgi:glycosyltransferase involved in cell wall biosynthesis